MAGKLAILWELGPLAKLNKFQVESSELQSAILSEDEHNQLKIAYNLIVDNKRFADATAMYSISAFYTAGSPPPPLPPPAFSPSDPNPSPFKPHPERIAQH
ncbi:hypothetical protein Pmani_034186 [Petrolisthes manimaculis]|uniref:non-specific serine/threonine protein kinase n=1 Tax=Petrolisthes manimaculis TaxID=1843537 RepID=A0AAE1TPE4_9EUCA|nr:hypothetical protein Pmani_034186 [Petrolisthes manimaculis]